MITRRQPRQVGGAERLRNQHLDDGRLELRRQVGPRALQSALVLVLDLRHEQREGGLEAAEGEIEPRQDPPDRRRSSASGAEASSARPGLAPPRAGSRALRDTPGRGGEPPCRTPRRPRHHASGPTARTYPTPAPREAGCAPRSREAPRKGARPRGARASWRTGAPPCGGPRRSEGLGRTPAPWPS